MNFKCSVEKPLLPTDGDDEERFLHYNTPITFVVKMKLKRTTIGHAQLFDIDGRMVQRINDVIRKQNGGQKES